MKSSKPTVVHEDVELEPEELADLTVQAAKCGVTTPKYLGYHVLRSAYGALSPRVVEFERLAKLRQSETDTGEGDGECGR